MKKISIGSDHAGFTYKKSIIARLNKLGYEVKDHGPFNDESVDYPDFIHPVAKDVENGLSVYGIILCGSGNGAAMTANKHQGIRAALCWKKEIAILARLHNDANILAIPARYVSKKLALEMLEIFLTTRFEGGRHIGRIAKIPV
ncbi:MAG: ribose 5-phosphate isomerase B [Deltaproteobacteria bacterium]